jgi:3-oxoacyl-[acyl-carrier-protein] synthase II
VVSPFGVGRERYWQHISRGCSGTRAITEFDVSTYPCQVAAPVPPVSMADAADLAGDDDHNGRADPKRYSRAALFGVVAAREAWRDAGLRAGEAGAGVLIGSGGGGIDVGEKQYEDFFVSGGRHVTPYAIAVGICGMVSSEISISLGLRGMSHVLSCGCTSSTDAIGYASSLIRSGEYDVLLSGGTDGCVLPGMIFGFSRMRAVSTRYNDRPATASRPFDRGRDGFVLGEGAWMLVLEREDRARARGATIYARIEGYASTCDAYHRVQMDPDGAEIVRCLETALDKARRSPDEIGYVNYHGGRTWLRSRRSTASTCRGS